MPTARSGSTRALNGIIYAAGGEVQNGSYSRRFARSEAYDPGATPGGSALDAPAPARPIMAVLGNRIHVAGGSVQSAIVPLPRA